MLLAKLNAFGFSESVLALIHSYLSTGRQRVAINDCLSTWKETNLGVPQDSVLGPLLCNIYIINSVSLMNGTEICSYMRIILPCTLAIMR